jgi:putative oxidoreductase
MFHSSILYPAARILLGAIFTFAGLNGYALIFGWEPAGPTSLHVPLMQWLIQTPVVFIPLKTLEVSAGVLLLANRWVPQVLLALFPLGVSIFGFHLLFDPGLILNGIIVLLLIGILLRPHKRYYSGILKRTANQP